MADTEPPAPAALRPPSPLTRRRVLALASWLAVAGLLIRIAAAAGTFRDIGDPVPLAAGIEVVVGLVLLVMAVALVAGIATRAEWAPSLSRVAALLGVPYGLSLLAASHESGALVAMAALLAAMAGSGQRPEPRRPT